MKTPLPLLVILICPQLLLSAIVTGTYSSQSFFPGPNEYAYGSFQYDSSQNPTSYDSIGNALYYPTSSLFTVYYPANNYSFVGTIEWLEIGNNIVQSINFGLPYDYFRIWARNGSGQTTIYLIDSTATAFQSNALPESFNLSSFDIHYFEISGDAYRQKPLQSISVVPEASSILLLVFSMLMFAIFLKRKCLTSRWT